MPPRKKPARRPSKTTAKPKARRSPKTKALAISDAVKRAAPQRSMFDSQIDWLGAFAPWSPVQILVRQQAAFWEGYTAQAAAERATGRKSAAKTQRSTSSR